jgi:hypothetical protein
MVRSLTTLANGAATIALAEPRPLAPPGLISGNPKEVNLVLFETGTRDLRVGLWACTAYTERYDYYPFDELMIILSGQVEIIDAEGHSGQFGPGDAFIMHKGFCGLWRQTEYMMKYYAILTDIDESLRHPTDER